MASRHQIGMWALVHPLLLMCFLNFGPSLSKILASDGQSVAGPCFFHILVNMSFNSSLHVGLVWDLKLHRLWYLAAAVTDIDLERGRDRGRSWFVRLLGESSLFSGSKIFSMRRFSNSTWSPSRGPILWVIRCEYKNVGGIGKVIMSQGLL